MLARCGVARTAAFGQPHRDAVLDLLGPLARVRELRPYVGHFEPQPTDAGQYAAVRLLAHRRPRGAALRLEVAELTVEQVCLLGRVVQDEEAAAWWASAGLD